MSSLRQVMRQMWVYLSILSLGIIHFYRTSDKNCLTNFSLSEKANEICANISMTSYPKMYMAKRELVLILTCGLCANCARVSKCVPSALLILVLDLMFILKAPFYPIEAESKGASPSEYGLVSTIQ